VGNSAKFPIVVPPLPGSNGLALAWKRAGQARDRWHAPVGDRRTKDRLIAAQRRRQHIRRRICRSSAGLLPGRTVNGMGT